MPADRLILGRSACYAPKRRAGLSDVTGDGPRLAAREAHVEWTDALNVGVQVIDTDHEQFVAQVNAAATAPAAELPRLFAELVEHTRAHFAREEAIMDATGFFASVVHKAEHQRVLAEMDRVADRLEAFETATALTYLATDLPAWFLQHRDTMDLVTASFARQHGY